MKRHTCGNVEIHRLAGLHIHTTTLSVTVNGIGEGEVFRHVVVLVFQFETRVAASRDVRPLT